MDIIIACLVLFFSVYWGVFLRISDNRAQKSEGYHSVCSILTFGNNDFRCERFCMKKKNCNAYFTVEATFIIPMVLLLIVLMIQYGFFCYEKSISVQCCYLAGLRASNEWELSQKEMEKFAMDEAEKLLKERALYPIERDISADVTLIGLEVEDKGYMEVLFSLIRKDSVNKLEINSKKSVGKTIPTVYIRRYHAVKDSGGEDDGDNQ